MEFFAYLLSPEALEATRSFTDLIGGTASIVVEDIVTYANIVVEDIVTRGAELASNHIVVEDIVTRGAELASNNIVVEDIVTRA